MAEFYPPRGHVPYAPPGHMSAHQELDLLFAHTFYNNEPVSVGGRGANDDVTATEK